MIDKEILQEIRQDFYLSGANDFLKIPDDSADEFWIWFENTATAVPLAGEKLDTINYTGYAANRCFGNSQSLYYHTGVPCHEGFVKAGLGFIHHGYNVYDNLVHDLTYESNIDAFLKLNENPPGPYFGIEVPAEIALSNKESVDLKGYNTPLLFKLFQSAK